MKITTPEDSSQSQITTTNTAHMPYSPPQIQTHSTRATQKNVPHGSELYPQVGPS